MTYAQISRIRMMLPVARLPLLLNCHFKPLEGFNWYVPSGSLVLTSDEGYYPPNHKEFKDIGYKGCLIRVQYETWIVGTASRLQADSLLTVEMQAMKKDVNFLLELLKIYPNILLYQKITIITDNEIVFNWVTSLQWPRYNIHHQRLLSHILTALAKCRALGLTLEGKWMGRVQLEAAHQLIKFVQSKKVIKRNDEGIPVVTYPLEGQFLLVRTHFIRHGSYACRLDEVLLGDADSVLTKVK